MLEDVLELLQKAEKTPLTANNVTAITATIRTILAIYQPEDRTKAVDSVTDGRKVPVRQAKQGWWSWLKGD